MENIIMPTEKFLLISLCILTISELCINYISYSDYNNSYISLITLIVGAFIFVSITSYTILRLSTKKEYNWLIYIIGVFISMAGVSLIYKYINSTIEFSIVDIISLSISLIRIILTFFIITHDVIRKIYFKIKWIITNYDEYQTII